MSKTVEKFHKSFEMFQTGDRRTLKTKIIKIIRGFIYYNGQHENMVKSLIE